MNAAARSAAQSLASEVIAKVAVILTTDEERAEIARHVAHLLGAEKVGGTDGLTNEEIDALLWAVRAIPLDRLRDGPYRPGLHGGGHGPLSTATNKIEAVLGARLRIRDARRV